MGKRSSWLKTNMAKPPTGNPVVGSRGPAWFRENPRRVVPPPAKNRSASGMSSSAEPLNASMIPKVVDRANTSDDRRNGVKVEFCTEKRRKVAVEPSDRVATLKSAVLKDP